MQPHRVGLLSGPEPIFGVCEAIGRDFRINPMWIRLAFGVGLLVNLGVALGVYALMAVVVLATRLLFPDIHAEVAEATSVRSEALAAEPSVEAEAVPELARAA